MRLPDIEEKDKPKRRPIPDHIPRREVELTPSTDACADCGGRLRRIGEAGEDQETVRRTVCPTMDGRAGIGAGRLAIVPGPMADNGSLRRQFVDIHRSQGSPIAEEATGRIAKLYAVEKQARGSPPDRRAELRRAHAAPVVDDPERWLALQPTTISGKSPLASAIRYALTRMERLRPCLDHGTLELDNNAAERSMRAMALGRRTTCSSVPRQAARPPPSPAP